MLLIRFGDIPVQELSELYEYQNYESNPDAFLLCKKPEVLKRVGNDHYDNIKRVRLVNFAGVTRIEIFHTVKRVQRMY